MHGEPSLVLSLEIFPRSTKHGCNLLVHCVEYPERAFCVEFVNVLPQSLVFALFNLGQGLLYYYILVEQLKLLDKSRKDFVEISEIPLFFRKLRGF